jgi:adenylate cyclase
VLPRLSFLAAVLLPLLGGALVGQSRPALLEDMRNAVFDGFQRIKPRVWTAEAPVRIIDVDEESLRRHGQWPWPRSLVADLIGAARKSGAAVIAFDFAFAEPDRMSPDQIARQIRDPAARAMLQRDLTFVATNDTVMAEAMRDAPVVLGTILSDQAATVQDFPQKAGFSFAGDDPVPWLVGFRAAVLPLPQLAREASGLGALNWLPSSDLVLREVPLVFRLGDRLVPGLAAEALRVAQGASTFVLRGSNASGQTALGAGSGLNAIRIGDFTVATGARGERRVYFSPTQPGRFVPAWKLLAGEVEADALEGRIVLVGTSAAGLLDQRATPLDRLVPGVEVHAQLIENIVAGIDLARPDWAEGAERMLALLLGIAIAAAAYWLAPVLGALAGLALAAGLFAAAAWAFLRHGLLIDPLFPSLAAGAVFLSGAVEQNRHERRQRQQVKEAFGRFVAPAVVARLAESPERLVLGGETRTLTLMFCDLRDFTSMSEGLDAAGIIGFMNDYLTPMTDLILQNDGTVDKYMGDAIMAFWNAPLDDPRHAEHAALTALAMTGALREFNGRRRALAAPAGRPFREARFGIGINTGACAVGNLGSVRRFDYSAIGDPVNVASRLEGLTKVYGLQILAAEETRAEAGDLAWLEVDSVRVKGRERPTRLFTLAGDRTVAVSPAFAAWRLLHQEMLAAYRAREFGHAALSAEGLGRDKADFAAFYAGFAAVCRDLAANPPPAGWDGVRTMQDK